jgi:glycosyltransferase involved in cell wall biosynthesis
MTAALKVSVLIPAYNSSATIAATLDSVLRQSVPPDEILIMDDGSTDETSKVLKRYGGAVKIFCQPNGGLSCARNALIRRATGNLIAFLDSDDLWHVTYLETQLKMYRRFPNAAAFFAAHDNFDGFGQYHWDDRFSANELKIEVFDPEAFFRKFQVAPGHFIMSFCCIPMRVLRGLGPDPFRLRAPAEDVYLCNLLPFWGPVVFASAPFLGAYRVHKGSLASNRLYCARGEVDAFGLLKEHYDAGFGSLRDEFRRAYAAKRRAYAKILQGAGDTGEARKQLLLSFKNCAGPFSAVKSMRLLMATYVPRPLQPNWPPVDRQ